MKYQDIHLSPGKSVDITGSRRELLLMLVGLTVGLGAVWVLTIPPASLDWLAVLKPGLGVILAVAVVWMWLVVALRLARAGAPVITLGPSGFLDRRQLRAPLAWSSVTAVDIARVQRNRYVRLTLVGKANLTAPYRLGTKILGLGGNSLPDNEFCISVTGLDTDLRTLMAQVITTAALNGHAVAARGANGAPQMGRGSSRAA